jgi:hypothetical protein
MTFDFTWVELFNEAETERRGKQSEGGGEVKGGREHQKETEGKKKT